MFFTNVIITFFFYYAALFGSFAHMARAIPLGAGLERRDVAVPPVLYPHAGTVWTKGQRHNVTWDISNLPAQITNPTGVILLRKGELSTPVILADGFSIRDGRVEVTVPWVLTDSDYSLVLFGDSGNFSPTFTIIGDSPF